MEQLAELRRRLDQPTDHVLAGPSGSVAPQGLQPMMKNPGLNPRQHKDKASSTAGDNISVTGEVARYVNGESEEEEEDGEIESGDD